MKYLEIHDYFQGKLALSVDLKQILSCLGTISAKIDWRVLSHVEDDEELFATGAGAELLEHQASSGKLLSTAQLMAIAEQITQVIWGEFHGFLEGKVQEPHVRIIAFDSSWFEVYSDDDSVLESVRVAFGDVRLGRNRSGPCHV